MSASQDFIRALVDLVRKQTSHVFDLRRDVKQLAEEVRKDRADQEARTITKFVAGTLDEFRKELDRMTEGEREVALECLKAFGEGL